MKPFLPDILTYTHINILEMIQEINIQFLPDVYDYVLLHEREYITITYSGYMTITFKGLWLLLLNKNYLHSIKKSLGRRY